MKDKIKIVTDSTCDLPDDILEQYDIEIVPLKVIFFQDEYKDRVQLKPQDFYEKLKSLNFNPTTSQPSPGDFIEVYSKAIAEGFNKIISIHISSKLSGTVGAASMAASTFNNAEIKIIDSKNTSLGLGFVVLNAAIRACEDRDISDIIGQIDNDIRKSKVYFSVDSLDYLERGGRIGKAKSFLGKLLNFKPVLTLEDGVVVPLQNAKGKIEAIRRLSDLAGEYIKNSVDAKFLGLLHSDSAGDAEQLLNLSKEHRNWVQIISTQLGCVVGSHVGPGAVGVVVL